MKTKRNVTVGDVLRKGFMEPLDLTASKLAKATKTKASHIQQIVEGKKAISPDMAIRLAKCFGNESKYWLEIQTNFLLTKEWEKRKKEYQQIKPLSGVDSLPISDPDDQSNTKIGSNASRARDILIQRAQDGNKRASFSLAMLLRDGLDALLKMGSKGNELAIWNAILLANRLTEKILLLAKKDPEIVKSSARVLPVFPDLLEAHRAKKEKRKFAESIELGKRCRVFRRSLKKNAKWHSPAVFYVWKTLEYIEALRQQPIPKRKTKTDRIKNLKRLKELPPFSTRKEILDQWFKEAIMPTVKKLYPKLIDAPEFQHIKTRARIKREGEKTGFLWSELAKDLRKATKAIAPTHTA